MTSMARMTKNDNKRRGFKGTAVMDGVNNGATSSRKHQTFTADTSSSSLKSSAPYQSSSPLKSSLPRLIPPSERANLPGNIIVSSVDVEAGEWDSPPGMSTQTRMEMNFENFAAMNKPTNGTLRRPEWKHKWNAGGDGEFVATQREAPADVSGGGASEPWTSWDWEEVEKGWEGYPELGTEAVEAGVILLWKVCSSRIFLSTSSNSLTLHRNWRYIQ
jgi:hypothetical protein